MSKEEKEKVKINLKDLTYPEITNLLINNPDVQINGGVLFMVLAKQEQYFQEIYGLKVNTIIKPDTDIKNTKGETIFKR